MISSSFIHGSNDFPSIPLSWCLLHLGPVHSLPAHSPAFQHEKRCSFELSAPSWKNLAFFKTCHIAHTWAKCRWIMPTPASIGKQCDAHVLVFSHTDQITWFMQSKAISAQVSRCQKDWYCMILWGRGNGGPWGAVGLHCGCCGCGPSDCGSSITITINHQHQWCNDYDCSYGNLISDVTRYIMIYHTQHSW